MVIKESSTNLKHPKYRPDIDGLRAIAVSVVVAFHAFPTMMPGGFIGVDIFFVISGFLISTIIIGNLEHDTFKVFEFYDRRIRRIFPALIIIMLFCMIMGWCVLLTDEYQQIGKHISAASVFIQNFVLWNEAGYFDIAAEKKPLLHLWSLAIEEQFYIFWPLLMAFMWKRKWNFLNITATFAIVSFVSNIYLSISDPTAGFYSPIARFWELMVGAILAYLQLHKPEFIQKHRNIQSIFGFVCIALGLMFLNKERTFPGWWALLPTLGTFFIISAGSASWLNCNVLSNRLLVWLGLISYPLYLWHWPLLSFTSIIRPGSGYKLKIVLICLSILLAVGTYLYIERPFRKNATKAKSLRLIYVMASILIAGTFIRFSQIDPRLHDTINVTSKTEWTFLKSRKVDFVPNCTGAYPLHQERKEVTLFIGDSQLAQYAERIFYVQNQFENSNGAIFAVGGGCPPIPNVYTDNESRDGCWSERDSAFQFATDKRVSTVVLGGSWYWYFLDKGYYFLDKTSKESLQSNLGREKSLNALYDTLVNLKKLNKNVYLLIGNPISNEFDPHTYIPRLLPADSVKQIDRYAVFKKDQEQLRDMLIEVARRAGVLTLDPYSMICKNDKCKRISENGLAIFKDSSHFNPDWAIKHTSYIDISMEPYISANRTVGVLSLKSLYE